MSMPVFASGQNPAGYEPKLIHRETVEPKNSRSNLESWCFFSGLALIFGIGAYLFDSQNPSDTDQYTGTNDSAKMILIVSFAIFALLVIGTRFSYMKYWRINQADLIASAIKKYNTSAATNAPSTQFLTQSRLEQLERLLKIREAGGVSDVEFEEMKKSIFSNGTFVQPEPLSQADPVSDGTW